MSNDEMPRGQLSTIVLSALLKGDKYGYEIIDEIKNISGGTLQIKQPSLYSCLKRMEHQKLISSYWRDSDIGGKRHYYSITDYGKKYAEKWKTDLINFGNKSQIDDSEKQPSQPKIEQTNNVIENNDFQPKNSVNQKQNILDKIDNLNLTNTFTQNVINSEVVLDENVFLYNNDTYQQNNATNTTESNLAEIEKINSEENTQSTSLLNEILDNTENTETMEESSIVFDFEKEKANSNEYIMENKTQNSVSNKVAEEKNSDDIVIPTEYTNNDNAEEVIAISPVLQQIEEQISDSNKIPYNYDLEKAIIKLNMQQKPVVENKIENKEIKENIEDDGIFLPRIEKYEVVEDNIITDTEESQDIENNKEHDDAVFITTSINKSDLPKVKKIQPVRFLPDLTPKNTFEDSGNSENNKNNDYDIFEIKHYYHSLGIKFNHYFNDGGLNNNKKTFVYVNKLNMFTALIMFAISVLQSLICLPLLLPYQSNYGFVLIVLPLVALFYLCLTAINFFRNKYKSVNIQQLNLKTSLFRWFICVLYIVIALAINMIFGFRFNNFSNYVVTLICPCLFILIYPFKNVYQKILVKLKSISHSQYN